MCWQSLKILILSSHGFSQAISTAAGFSLLFKTLIIKISSKLPKLASLAFSYCLTRLHSSRMRTARSLTVSPSMLCLGAWSRGVWFWGESGPGGVVSQHALRQNPPPPWTEFLTHASENITLHQTSFAGDQYGSE